MEDDSLYGPLGSYECHAFAVGDVAESARHGFSVSVITSKFPDVHLLLHKIVTNIFRLCSIYKEVTLLTKQ